jgi:hypothetical protein
LHPNKRQESINEFEHINGMSLSNIFETDGNGNTILKENTQYHTRVLYVTNDQEKKYVIMSYTGSFITPSRPSTVIPTSLNPEIIFYNTDSTTGTTYFQIVANRTTEEFNAGQSITGYDIQLFDNSNNAFDSRIEPNTLFLPTLPGQYATFGIDIKRSDISFDNVHSMRIYKKFNPIQVTVDGQTSTISEVGTRRFIVPPRPLTDQFVTFLED